MFPCIMVSFKPIFTGINGSYFTIEHFTVFTHWTDFDADATWGIILFSQFVEMLKLIEMEVTTLGIPYSILTGSTNNRGELISRFQNDTALPLMLISLKAGGSGINLTAADTVIHYDPWWNPAVEAQATDRTHRIGQTKPVFIYKFITRGTVEETMLSMQQRKRSIFDGMLDEGDNYGGSITSDDIDVIFKPLDMS